MSAQSTTIEQLRVTIEDTVDDRYRVVRNWRLGVCSGFQVCGTFDSHAAAERQAAYVRTHEEW